VASIAANIAAVAKVVAGSGRPFIGTIILVDGSILSGACVSYTVQESQHRESPEFRFASNSKSNVCTAIQLRAV